jgi:HEAT repeat protein
VRESAVRALERLNAEGPDGELARAVRDDAVAVRLAAIHAASRVHATSAETILAIVERVGDPEVPVRRAAVEALGSMRIRDAALELSVLADPAREPDAEVRKAAVAALGQLRDPATREAVVAAQEDPDFLVRSAARIALRQL